MAALSPALSSARLQDLHPSWGWEDRGTLSCGDFWRPRRQEPRKLSILIKQVPSQQ